MAERMSSADSTVLFRERRTAPQHIGGLALLTPPPRGFDYDRLVRLLEERISLAPRYRQKVRMVPAHLAKPLWVDDPGFDITYHVRRSALPRPGTPAQLLEFCARIQSRLLDRSRPLWEMYLVEGLESGQIAIVTKTHAAIVGEHDGVDLAQVILDPRPTTGRAVQAIWMPQPEPGPVDLVRDAVLDVVRRPARLPGPALTAVRDLRGTAARATTLAGGVLTATAAATASVTTAVVRRPPASPLAANLGEQRRLAVARTRLEDYRRIRDAFGGTVNDVVLAVVAGALRGWLQSRTAALRSGSTVRALVPVSVHDGPEDDRVSVRPLLVDLPVGEPDAVLRLAQLRFAMATHKASGRAVGADRIAGLAGFAPPTMHALAARAAGELTRRLHSLVVTNVPGPQLPLYAAGARLDEMVPIAPLTPGHALSVALSSYDGGVCYGLNADRDAVPDLDLLAALIPESLAELVAAIGTGAVVAVGVSGGPGAPR